MIMNKQTIIQSSSSAGLSVAPSLCATNIWSASLSAFCPSMLSLYQPQNQATKSSNALAPSPTSLAGDIISSVMESTTSPTSLLPSAHHSQTKPSVSDHSHTQTAKPMASSEGDLLWNCMLLATS
jgi:hypothetical protein